MHRSIIVIKHPLLIVTGYETSEDKVYKEPLLTDLDEPPPASVISADPAPMASITLECSQPTYTEYPEPGQPTCAGGQTVCVCVGGGAGRVADGKCVFKIHADSEKCV